MRKKKKKETVTDYFYLWEGSCHWLVVEEMDRNPKKWPIGEKMSSNAVRHAFRFLDYRLQVRRYQTHILLLQTKSDFCVRYLKAT